MPSSRNEKLENILRNHSMIMMGVFEEAFADMAESMTRTLATGAGGQMSARRPNANPRSKEAGRPVDAPSPELRAQIKDVFTDIREEIDSQWPKNPEVFRTYVANPRLDEGIKIVESYDFGRPKLTEELSDGALASYVFLLKAGDKRLGEMFKELADWQGRLPRPPWASLR